MSSTTQTASQAQDCSLINRSGNFRAYLGALDPLLAEYVVHFEQAGVRCEDDMRSLLRFSRENLEEFLKKEFDKPEPLTPFQLWKVIDVLNKASCKLFKASDRA